MRALLFAAVAAAVLPLLHPAVTRADVSNPPPPPYIDHTEWVHWGGFSSLRVYPTPAGREASTDFVNSDEAWSEVLADALDADSPGMHEQFVCHWQLAEFAQPGKTSWNLEPWRPVVDPVKMIDAGCNPGGIEDHA